MWKKKREREKKIPDSPKTWSIELVETRLIFFLALGSVHYLCDTGATEKVTRPPIQNMRKQRSPPRNSRKVGIRKLSCNVEWAA